MRRFLIRPYHSGDVDDRSPGLHGGATKRHNGDMRLLSELVAQGRVRNREDLRRVYRRLVKKLHPDSARAFAAASAASERSGAGSAPGEGGFVDFDELKRELGEAERLLAELDAREGLPGDQIRESGSGGPDEAADSRQGGGPAVFSRALLIGELRDLVARGFPIQPRALARNKAYRTCVATITAQMALLTGESDAFARVDAEMRAVQASSLSLVYHAMQVLWNGLDWGMMGMEWSRHAALRDYETIKDELAARGLRSLDRLLSWIIEADRVADFGARAGSSKRR